ncbi:MULTISPECIES: hypothetical protein [unclassified Duganella]|uniref:hypothetical protein n=1 Tax=unclassified Duganella TaxID=2636909 RepID=UPI000880108C|nr:MULTISPECIES: hypothetical protein [unclassified Duganella]SDH34872.1 hypothetical protein SAMN05216320_112107 [Duganella sp. OV458]SDK51384.1 hypothetical protein SAMN05428973_112107 [Duganella sp. OV510]
MNIIKPAALTAAFLIGMLVCEAAWAQEPVAMAAERKVDAEYAKLPVCTLNAEGTGLAVEPCRKAPAQVPAPRRAVTQIIEPMPQVKRAPQVAMPGMQPSPSLQSLTNPPRAPVPVTSCDAAGCYGANGVRYNNMGGGVVGPNGKVCNRSGAMIQC